MNHRGLMYKKEFDTSYVGFMKDGAQWLVDNTVVKLVGKISYYLFSCEPFCLSLSSSVIYHTDTITTFPCILTATEGIHPSVIITSLHHKYPLQEFLLLVSSGFFQLYYVIILYC